MPRAKDKNPEQKNDIVTASEGNNLEEVEATLQQIRGEKQSGGKKNTFRRII